MNRSPRVVAMGFALLSGASAIAEPRPTSAQDAPPIHAVRQKHGVAFRRPQLQVAVGSQTAAENYYKNTLSPQTGFLTPQTILTSNLQDLLDYVGYPQVKPKDLHRLSSAGLMGLGAEGDILATRFFAPKITDVADKPPVIPDKGFGWRKLVRFQSKTGSPADQRGIESLYFLQNVFETDLQADPFNADKNFAKFNQAILVRKGNTPSPSNHAAYFATYGELVEIDPTTKLPVKDASGNFKDHGPLITLLQATFDEEDRDPETNLPAKDYFVPNSCIECHGRSAARGKLNFLDTDHWFDRVTPQYGVDGGSPLYRQEDFTALAGGPYGVLYDAGKDPAQPQFERALKTIRAMNNEISDQNVRSGQAGGGIPFQAQAAKKWIDLHTASAQHVPPYKRGFGATVWDENDQTQRKALYFLNRYCYRCHSSVIYNVFDKAAVKPRISSTSGSIKERILNVEDLLVWMPQDRIIPGLTIDKITGEGKAAGDLKEFIDVLDAVNAGP